MLLIILCAILLIAGVLLGGQPIRKRAIPCATIGIGLLATGTVAYIQAPLQPIIHTLAEIRALPDRSPALLVGHVSNQMRAIEGSYVAYTNGVSDSHTPVLLITLSDGSEITLSDGEYVALNWPVDDQVYYLTNGDPVVVIGQVSKWTQMLGNCEYVGQRSAGFLFFKADTIFAGTLDSYLAYLNPAWPILKLIPYVGWISGSLLIGVAAWFRFSRRSQQTD